MEEDKEFKKHTSEALGALQRALLMAGDDYGFESKLQGGAITVTFEHPPGKFVIGPDAASRQLRVTAGPRHYKLDWDIVENTFVQPETRETVKSLLEQAISKHLKQEVEL
jgi:frataxin-like iron-binding protein CyaY